MATTLELTPRGDSKPPSFVEGERHALPDGLIDALRLASRFLRKAVSRRQVYRCGWQKFIAFDAGRVYATNNSVMVEVDLGDCALPAIALNAKEVRLLASFGQNPVEASVSEQQVVFHFDEGEICQLPGGALRNVFEPIFSDYWIMTSRTVKVQAWQKDFAKLFRSHSKKEYFTDVSANLFKSRSRRKNASEVAMEVETGAVQDRRFHTQDLVKVVRVARSIDFSSSHACFAFDGGRGIISGLTP